MTTLIQDLRYGLRMLGKNPGFAAVIVVTLALGIGANTAIFSVVNTVLLKPLPYRDADRVVMVWEQNLPRGWYHNIVSAANFVDWRKQNDVFSRMAAADPFKTFNLTGTGRPEEVGGEQVSTSLFSLLGVRPLRGRDFLPEEDRPGGAKVVILSYGLWQRRFGGDPELVGRPISINGESYTVVGVMPAGFYFPPFWRDWNSGELWVPGLDLSDPMRTRHGYIAVGRLKPDVPLAQAQSEMDTIARRLDLQYPEAKGWGVSLVGIHDDAVGKTRQPLLVLLVAVGFVLLIACANVANLMLARSAVREKEIAIRTALGAGRGRLIRQLLTESLLLALAGGALGLLVAVWGLGVLAAVSGKAALGFSGFVSLSDVTISGRVLAFTLIVALATGVIFGVAPALAASHPDLNHSLKEGGRSSEGAGRHRLRGALVVAEFALALVLLAGAGLMIRTLAQLGRVDLGFNPHNVLALYVPLLGPRYKDPRRQVEFFSQLIERVKALPGVESASLVRGLPVEGWLGWGFVTGDNPAPPPNQAPDANYQVAGPDYFRVMNIPLRTGRYFTAEDSETSTRVAIVNETWARQQWPGKNPIGRRVKVNLPDAPWLTVVGVVGNIRSEGLDDPSAFAEVYLPYTQYPWELAPRHLVVRTASKPTSLEAEIRHEVAAIDKDQPVSGMTTMDEVVAEAVSDRRFAMLLLGAFAALAMLLAAVGIYGVVAYSVEQRTREVGIRMALGAQSGDVLRLVVGQGLILTLVGVAAGLAGTLALTQFLASMLYGVRPRDPLTFAAATLVLVAVALLGSYLPARRATTVDPIVALREL